MTSNSCLTDFDTTKDSVVNLNIHSANGQSPSIKQEALLTLLSFLKAHSYQFTVVTPVTHARVNARYHNETDMRAIFGWNRPFPEANVDEELFDLMRDADVLEQDGDYWRSRIRIASLASELFVHSAFPTTQADAIFFGPDTYRFIAALKYHLARRNTSIKRILDIGCGAGPGAIIAAKIFPQAEVIGTDINESAIDIARFNASAAQADNVKIIRSDLFDNLTGEFDLIIANPPYLIDASQRAYRHGGGDLGAGLSEAIVEGSLQRLSPNGSLMLYTGVAICDGIDPFHERIECLLGTNSSGNNFKWIYEEIDPDIFSEELLQEFYASADRIAAVRLEVFRRTSARNRDFG